MTCAILELVRKVVENVQRDSIVQNLKGQKLSRKESKKRCEFLQKVPIPRGFHISVETSPEFPRNSPFLFFSYILRAHTKQ